MHFGRWNTRLQGPGITITAQLERRRLQQTGVSRSFSWAGGGERRACYFIQTMPLIAGLGSDQQDRRTEDQ